MKVQSLLVENVRQRISFLRSRSIHLWSIIIVCKKENELWCRNGKTVKVQIWPLTFDPKSKKVLLRSRPTYMWSIIIVSQMEEEILYRNYFFLSQQTYGQTDRHSWWNQYTSITSLAGVYKLIFNLEKSLKNDPPGGQNFTGGHFFTTFDSKFMLNFEPCQLLTFKNDPRSHFLRWKMGSLFNVTPAIARYGINNDRQYKKGTVLFRCWILHLISDATVSVRRSVHGFSSRHITVVIYTINIYRTYCFVHILLLNEQDINMSSNWWPISFLTVLKSEDGHIIIRMF